jgi:hypothetical protein
MEDGRIQGQMCGQELLINQVFIQEQLGVSREGTFYEAKSTSKKIIGLHAFIENE